MALAYFETERGFSINDNVKIITGTGAPGTSGDSTTVDVASIYMNQSDGSFYKKITAGSGTNKWEELSAAGDLASLQTEVDNIETSLGSMVGTDGTFTALSGTNHLDGAADVSASIVLLDTEIGADVVAVARTNNPIVNGSAVNSNIDALDQAIGLDATYVTRTVGQLSNSNSVLSNLDAIDTAVGSDSQVASTNYITTANSLMQNLSALDAGIQSSIDGLDAKESVRAATTGTLTTTAGNGTWVQAGAGVGATLTAGVAGTTTIDTVLLADGDRLLVKDEGNSDNGIYVVSNAAVGLITTLTRATDFDGTPTNEVTANSYMFVSEGSAANVDKGFVLVTNDPITVDTTVLVFSIFSSAGGLGALQTEVDNIEAALGSCVNSSGNFVAFTTSNHMNGSGDVCNAIELLDAEIGADPAANTRTNNPIVVGSDLNNNIEALDDAIGANADLTPVTRTTGAVALASTLMANLDALDLYLGNDVVPTTRTVGPLVAANDVGGNLEALDVAVGTDAQLTAAARTAGPIVTSQSVNQNIDDLDTAIGPDVTSTNFAVAASAVNANISNLDSKIGANLADGNVVLAASSIMANLAALDQAIDSVGVQVATSVSAATLTTIDSVLVDTILSTQWLVHVQDGTNFEVMVVEAVHDNIPAGADAANTDHTVYAKLRIGAVAGIAISVDLNGAAGAQQMRLRITTTNASEVTIMRFGLEA